MSRAACFREYDIRGIVAEQLTLEFAQDFGRALGTHLLRNGGRRVSVGFDGRISSPDISDGLVEGLRSTGVDVVRLGLCHTPLVYFSVFHLRTDGAVMVTASHNPPEFNGFKVCVGELPMYGESLKGLAALMKRRDFLRGAGDVTDRDLFPVYEAELRSGFEGMDASGLHVVVDCGNGTAGLVAPRILREVGCRVTELFSEVDGTFPNHHADPTVEENLQALKAEVREHGADLGIAYDGDVDRIGVIDGRGEVVWGDMLSLLFGQAILDRQPGAAFVFDVKCSQHLFDELERCGGRPIMWKTGHSLIKAKMREAGGALGGEMSGHIFFADRYFGFDDAVYASLRLVELLVDSGRSLAELTDSIPKSYVTPEIRLDCPDDSKFGAVERAKAVFETDWPVVDIDGARVQFPDGWGLIRASNTQPAIVVRAEAASEERLSEIEKTIRRAVRDSMGGRSPT